MVRTLVVLADGAEKPGLLDTLPPWGLLVGGLVLLVLGVVIYLVGQALGDDTGIAEIGGLLCGGAGVYGIYLGIFGG